MVAEALARANTTSGDPVLNVLSHRVPQRVIDLGTATIHDSSPHEVIKNFEDAINPDLAKANGVTFLAHMNKAYLELAAVLIPYAKQLQKGRLPAADALNALDSTIYAGVGMSQERFIQALKRGVDRLKVAFPE